MTEEELLEKAKRDYPPGTEFKCVNSNNLKYPHTHGNDNIVREELGCVEIGSYEFNIHHKCCWIYLENKWAEIIFSPTSKELNWLIYI